MILGSLVAEATTDADGRFRITGLGRDRLVSLWMSGRQVAWQEIKVQTRMVPPAQEELPGKMVNGRPPTRPIYGASFVHIAEPGRSIQGIVRERGTGKPIAGALVNSLPTDGQGRFRIDGLTRKFEYQLDVNGPAGTPYLFRRLTVASQGTGLDPVTAEVELEPGRPGSRPSDRQHDPKTDPRASVLCTPQGQSQRPQGFWDKSRIARYPMRAAVSR